MPHQNRWAISKSSNVQVVDWLHPNRWDPGPWCLPGLVRCSTHWQGKTSWFFYTTMAVFKHMNSWIAVYKKNKGNFSLKKWNGNQRFSTEYGITSYGYQVNLSEKDWISSAYPMFLKIFYYKKIRVHYFPHIPFIHPPMFVDQATPRSGSERKAMPSSNWSWSADASPRRDLGLTPFPGCRWPPPWHYTFRVWESLLLRNCWEGEQPNTYW